MLVVTACLCGRNNNAQQAELASAEICKSRLAFSLKIISSYTGLGAVTAALQFEIHGVLINAFYINL